MLLLHSEVKLENAWQDEIFYPEGEVSVMEIPKSHPRYLSLTTREKLVKGVREGLAVLEGLIAHGRGEAFDYILGEKSHDFALEAERAAVALMKLAEHPVISVNGNAASLVAEELVELSKTLNAPLEVNIFHYSKERVEKIAKKLEEFGGTVYYKGDAVLEGIDHARRIVDSRGILKADVVLVPLEDGDRCEILKKHGKKVIAIDLNPLSRTARMADITIVNNITRAVPEMIKFAKEITKEEAKEVLRNYDNKTVLKRAIEAIRDHLTKMAEDVMNA